MLSVLLLCCPPPEVSQLGELCTIIRQHRVDLVGHRGDEGAQEIGSDPACGLLMQLGKGKLAGTVNGDKELQAAFFRMHLGNVDMEVAKRVLLALLLGGYVACYLRQAADAMALAATMQ